MIDAIHACFGPRAKGYVAEVRLQSVVLAHLKPSTLGDRTGVLAGLEVVVEAHGRRVDWRVWLRTWRQALKKTRPD